MKSTVLILLLLGSIHIGCKSVAENEVLALSVKDESYKILNELIDDNQLHVMRLCEVPLESLSPTGEAWSREFSPADVEYMLQCQDSMKGESFQQGQLVSWSARKQDWAEVEVVPADDSTFYDEISWPLFDLKKEKALVHVVSDANGMLSGSGHKVLYKKVRGRWRPWKYYARWIS